MQIHSLQSSSGVQPVSRNSAPKAASEIQSAPAVNSSTGDQLDLSAEAQQIGQTQAPEASSGIRTQKVAELRQAIANGTYETPEKMSAAIDKMLDTFA